MNTKTKLEKIKSEEIDLEEESHKFLQRITESNINAFITVNEKQVLEQAKKIKQDISNGTAKKLAGLHVSVKDNIAVKDMRMTCASKMLENYTAPYNATLVERVLENQSIIIGKTNMD
ncbi:MAG: Asp-tRNA(Asn)/Glu-tRNA(Gln) amidotransferase subunit GatA, partial [Candidatus Diapherotrites archaeon]|nr:Asp-tRNA(Asn)/Glu-tRNA(Gln) amidotransferase subunit GatA [Candidatus Diapherotrites archaeon]